MGMAETQDPTKKDYLQELQEHYDDWNDDADTRRTRPNGWNDVIDAYNNKLPDDFPYLSRVVDPRIRTTLIEKKARLTNAKLKGRLLPRKGTTILKARLNNSLLDYQWDLAEEGGTMNSKIGEMDIDSRMFGSSFGYVYWSYEEKKNKDGEIEIVKNNNDLKVLNPNDCGIDPNCTDIRDAKWFQMREFKTIEELESENNLPTSPKYPGLAKLKMKLSENSQNTRESNYNSRNLQLKGLEDRLGYDKSFPVVEIVTEFRQDKWCTFAPKYNVLLREIENPYRHGKIPVVQLRYYQLLDDPWGESEVESVLPIWRAIQATINGYLDSMNLHMNPPLKILEGAVRMETIIWSPDAHWIMTSLDAVQEHRGTGEALRYFQTTYTSLVAAFNQAMGDMSQGVSSVDPFSQDKTATEVKATVKQQNVRDQDNQSYLADMIKDMMMMWISNNQQFLFANEDMHEYVLQIVGQEMFDYFKKSGLAETHVPEESVMMIKDIIDETDGEMSNVTLQELYSSAEVPVHPVLEDPTIKNKDKQSYKPKMRVSERGDSAEISLLPEDLEGFFSYIPDVKSMSLSASDDQLKAQNTALQTLINPTVGQLLQMEGVRPNVKDIIQSIFENSGLRDPDKYFSTLEGAASPTQAIQQPGLSAVPTPQIAGEQQMARPQAI